MYMSSWNPQGGWDVFTSQLTLIQRDQTPQLIKQKNKMTKFYKRPNTRWLCEWLRQQIRQILEFHLDPKATWYGAQRIIDCLLHICDETKCLNTRKLDQDDRQYHANMRCKHGGHQQGWRLAQLVERWSGLSVFRRTRVRFLNRAWATFAPRPQATKSGSIHLSRKSKGIPLNWASATFCHQQRASGGRG